MRKVLMLLVLWSVAALAEDQKVLTVTNSYIEAPVCITLKLDAKKDISAAVFSECNKSPRQSRINTVLFPNDLSDGKSIFKFADQEIAKVYSPNFSSHNGGHIVLTIRDSLVMPNYLRYEFELERSGDKWVMRRNGSKVTRMHCKISVAPFINTPQKIKECSTY